MGNQETEKLPQKGVWISVDIAVPRIGQDCIVFMPKAYTKIDVQRCYNNGRWKPTWADGWNKGQTFEITHWMIVDLPTDSTTS